MPTSSNDWRAANQAFANKAARRFAKRSDVAGVVIGGSIARKQDWQHSDVELGILVPQRLDLSYFHIIDGRGVEAIQLAQPELEQRLAQADTDDEVVAAFPIQLYQCRVVSDPTGLLARFKQTFDARLFTPGVVQTKRAHHLKQFDHAFDAAKTLLDSGQPLSALAKARMAFNDLILAFYWQHGILPRSQNRTEYLLRLNCRRLGRTDFYDVFMRLYGLDIDGPEIRRRWAACREDVLGIYASWGPDLPPFFQHAVDGDFAWGQPRSILTVHRLFVPLVMDYFLHQGTAFDSAEWQDQHPALLAFLSFDTIQPNQVKRLFREVERQRARILA